MRRGLRSGRTDAKKSDETMQITRRFFCLSFGYPEVEMVWHGG